MPDESHVRALVSEPDSHPAVAHTVPAFARVRHDPMPSQVPSPAHDDGYPVPTTQASFGSVSALIGPHTPSAPLPFLAAEQAMHPSVHASSQQTPSTQLPLAHSFFRVQAAPSSFLGAQLFVALQ